jgi:peptidyl-prolyl cis-trans isomerase SurA
VRRLAYHLSLALIAVKEFFMTILPPHTLLHYTKRLVFFCLFIFAFFINENATCKVVDRVVGVVNDEVILLSELEETGKTFFQKIIDSTPEAQRQEALLDGRNQVLDSLIEKKLIGQKAKTNKISISDEEFKKAFDQMVLRSGLSKEQFVDKIKQSGLTMEAYEKNFRYQLLENKLISYDIRSKIVITDAMVKEYYDNHAAKQTMKDGYYLLQMGFTWGQTPDAQKSAPNMYADKVDAKQRAERIHKLVKEGQDFKELAKKYSNLPSAKDGGDIGIFQEDDMMADMKEAVIHLKPGQISNIIETTSGFQFFKLIANKDGVDAQSSFESSKNEIRDILYEQQLRKEFDNWIKNLKEQAYIKKM